MILERFIEIFGEVPSGFFEFIVYFSSSFLIVIFCLIFLLLMVKSFFSLFNNFK